jgi:hypothetical protein
MSNFSTLFFPVSVTLTNFKYDDNWNSVYTTTKANSANWDSVYTTTKANSANWDSAYAYTSTYPLLTAMKVSGINLGSTAFINAFTVPAGKVFIATGLTVVFDSGALTNLVAGSIRLTKGSAISSANRIIADLNIGALTFPSNSLLRRSSINDNNATGQPGEVIQIVMNGAVTAYTATVIIEGVLY